MVKIIDGIDKLVRLKENGEEKVVGVQVFINDGGGFTIVVGEPLACRCGRTRFEMIYNELLICEECGCSYKIIRDGGQGEDVSGGVNDEAKEDRE